MDTTKNIQKIKAHKIYLDSLFNLILQKRTLSSLIYNIHKLGKEDSSKLGFDTNDSKYQEQITKKYNKITGGLFECFHILFNHVFENDPEVGLKSYSVTTNSTDFGVDATGVNANGIPCAVQVKFRNNINDFITYEDLCKTNTCGQDEFKIDTHRDNSIWIFTTGTVNYIATNRFEKRLKVVDRKLISRKIDNNNSFWEECWRLLQNIEELQ